MGAFCLLRNNLQSFQGIFQGFLRCPQIMGGNPSRGKYWQKIEGSPFGWNGWRMKKMRGRGMSSWCLDHGDHFAERRSTWGALWRPREKRPPPPKRGPPTPPKQQPSHAKLPKQCWRLLLFAALPIFRFLTPMSCPFVEQSISGAIHTTSNFICTVTCNLQAVNRTMKSRGAINLAF